MMSKKMKASSKVLGKPKTMNAVSRFYTKPMMTREKEFAPQYPTMATDRMNPEPVLPTNPYPNYGPRK